MSTFKVGDHVRVKDDTKCILNPSIVSNVAGRTGTVKLVLDKPIFCVDTIIDYDKADDGFTDGVFHHTELELDERKANDNV
jgi:hypothetical protein